MESNRGAGPATLVPPDSLATEIPDDRRSPARSLWRSMDYEVAELEVTRGLGGELLLPDEECDGDARAEIDATFQRKLAAIRRLPRRDQSHARRAALEERDHALVALRRKREATRQFRQYLRRLLAPKPQP